MRDLLLAMSAALLSEVAASQYMWKEHLREILW
jgi:hypothetical protein